MYTLVDMALYCILTLYISVGLIRGSNSCTSGSYKCNHQNRSTYFQCDHGMWVLRDCSVNLEWGGAGCVDPALHDTTCPNGEDSTPNTSFGPSTPLLPDSAVSTSGTSTPPYTDAIDHSTQCPRIKSGNACLCLSPNIKYVNLTREALEQILQKLKKELTLNKTSLAKSIRRKISAKDKRLSSQLMGYSGAIMIATPILIIMLSDAANLIRFLSGKNRRRNGFVYPA